MKRPSVVAVALAMAVTLPGGGLSGLDPADYERVSAPLSMG